MVSLIKMESQRCGGIALYWTGQKGKTGRQDSDPSEVSGTFWQGTPSLYVITHWHVLLKCVCMYGFKVHTPNLNILYLSVYLQTNTASVLNETIGYIHFLHDQIQVFNRFYLKLYFFLCNNWNDLVIWKITSND